MSRITRLLFVIPLLFLASCYQEERSYTMNPDGSGKVDYSVTFPLDSGMNFSFGDEKEKKPEEKLLDAVRDIFEESEGVAAWSDVSFKLTDDEKVEFRGTAYFSDLNLLELKMGSISSNNLNPVFTRDGEMVTIECSQEDDDEEEVEDEKEEGKKWEEMSEKEQDAEIAKAKQQILQVKAMATGLIGDMKSTVTFLLPEAPEKNNNFKKVSEKSYSVETSGAQMLEAFDTLLEDEALLRSAASGGVDMQDSPPDEIFEAMFGGPGNPSLSFSGKAAPSFDYKAEMKAAQEAAPAMMKKLGLAIVPATPMTGGGSFESLRLAGLRIVTASSDDDVRPFNWSKGVSLAFIGKLPGAVISADEGVVKSFILDNGQDLLSSKKWDREINRVDLSEDGTLVGFEISSDRLPTADATSIKQLTGELVCTAATGTEMVDLGFAKLVEGEEGKFFGAKIEEIGEGNFNKDKMEVSIRLKMKRELIKEVHFIDADGVKLKSNRNGYMWSGDSGTLTFTCDKSLTEEHRVEIETYAGVTRHVIPFNIENTALLPVGEEGE